MKILQFLWIWGRRIPAKFSVPFLVILILYLIVLERLVNLGFYAEISKYLPAVLSWFGIPNFVTEFRIISFFVDAIVTTVLLFIGILGSYNASVWLYRHLRKKTTVSIHDPVAPSPGNGNRLNRFKKIGIILAGGGAKGAYQAGAMKAIHEFLEEHNALDRVAMIAGTSIGSWNAMFWLSDLVKSAGPGQPSVHEQWWRSISISRIVEFDYYCPLYRNYFVRATPWQEMFEQMFIDPPAVCERLSTLTDPSKKNALHFYFTRSNVERGSLEFSTNWSGVADLKRPNFATSNQNEQEPVVTKELYEVIADTEPQNAIKRMKDAVFASMDLPPLFPYMSFKRDMVEWFEDGGVVDNLPVWFGTQIEKCDLLFVLPLNASFAEPVDHHSVTKRIFRVMGVRQGVLERNSFKLAYLYNELAELRKVSEAYGITKQVASAPSLRREHKPVSIFAICAGQPLLIGTGEFWKPDEAGQAFDLMYAQTKYELQEHFNEDTDPHRIRMTVVSSLGERSHVEDF